MRDKTCCFTGHRDIPINKYNKIKKMIKKELKELIKNGVIYYGSGGAIGFDMIAAETVLELKKKYPQIKLIMVYPCKNQTDLWNKKDKLRYETIKSRCDKYVYTSEKYSNSCFLIRDRHLVDCSGYCICYLSKNSGGTAYTVKYASKKDLKIINLAKR